jgi:hypothetical protein
MVWSWLRPERMAADRVAARVMFVRVRETEKGVRTRERDE